MCLWLILFLYNIVRSFYTWNILWNLKMNTASWKNELWILFWGSMLKTIALQYRRNKVNWLIPKDRIGCWNGMQTLLRTFKNLSRSTKLYVIQCVLSQVDAFFPSSAYAYLQSWTLDKKALTVTDFTASGKVIQKCLAETKVWAAQSESYRLSLIQVEHLFDSQLGSLVFFAVLPFSSKTWTTKRTPYHTLIFSIHDIAPFCSIWHENLKHLYYLWNEPWPRFHIDRLIQLVQTKG